MKTIAESFMDVTLLPTSMNCLPKTWQCAHALQWHWLYGGWVCKSQRKVMVGIGHIVGPRCFPYLWTWQPHIHDILDTCWLWGNMTFMWMFSQQPYSFPGPLSIKNNWGRASPGLTSEFAGNLKMKLKMNKRYMCLSLLSMTLTIVNCEHAEDNIFKSLHYMP